MAVPAPTDGALIAASLTDPPRFAELFDRRFPEIHRYLHRRVGRDLADDFAAETFTQAFRSRGTYDERRTDALPWLYGIATNLLRHHYRAERRRLLAYSRVGIDIGDDTNSADVDARIDAAALAPRMARVLAALRPADRDVLLLHAWADLSYTEIAEALSLPVGTVRSRLSAARSQAREQFADIGQYQDDDDIGHYAEGRS
jgi:RNA polymerase sigma factor (sigma-70 family)